MDRESCGFLVRSCVYLFYSTSNGSVGMAVYNCYYVSDNKIEHVSWIIHNIKHNCKL